MAADVLQIPGELDLDRKRAAAEHRRCILLGLLAGSSPNNPTLKKLLSDGLLVTVKSWLDDILAGAIGSVDLLLHLLSSIKDLPVTKSMVLSSGMGKAIRDIEKHKICAGSANESAIKGRVKAVKDAWNASVKVNKDPDRKKRAIQAASTDASPAKKKKVESSFSSLMKKVSKGDDSKPNATASQNGKASARNSENGYGNGSNGEKDSAERKAHKISAKRVKWVDHFGGDLNSTRQINDDNADSAKPAADQSNVSWSDRKKRDRIREKELLAKAKKSKIIDDDDDEDDSFGNTAISRMKPTIAWHPPRPLPYRSDVTKAQCTSRELAAQNERKTRVAPARYLSEEDVPSGPSPLTDVEEALDVASQASTVTASIPFLAAYKAHVPSAVPAPAVAAPAPMYSQLAPPMVMPPPPPMAPPVAGNGVAATAEMLQAMGLPLFLVGSNVHALQTLAQTPSLLSTFIGANGQYDQPRLMSLVQALTQNLPASQQIQQPAYQQPLGATMSYGVPQQAYQAPQATYGTTAYGTTAASTTQYAPPTTYAPAPPPATAFRTAGDAGNMHLSGYGPMTTQAEIIALFAPYVHVDEVVMKPNFSFVNTSDPDGANRAREALNGSLLGGMPIRINPATRRNPASAPGFKYGGSAAPTHAPIVPVAPAPTTNTGDIDYDSVRDDRGNPATKNLFVAGYGPGTTEQQIRDYFSQHCTVTGCVLKGTFAFVNTADRSMAVDVRQKLSGTLLNGGPLRVNFAKETGRLGTSFDSTYGGNLRSPYMRH